MKVRILRLGQAAHIVDIEPGTTVGDALDAAHLGADGYSLSLNGLGTSRETGISDGDVVTMVPKVVGGVAA